MLAARSKLITNPVIGELIDWYKVLKELPVMQREQVESHYALATV
jgi:hypothetical protein